MKRILQTITDDKNANCLQACLASLLDKDLEDVPNFMTFKKKWWDALELYLNQQGYDVGYIEPNNPPKDGSIYITSLEYPCGARHAVLTQNQIIIHDPSPRGINKDDERFIDGYYWISDKYR